MGIIRSLSLIILIGIATVGLTVNSVRAATVIYDESVSGDLTFTLLSPFALGVGTNIVSGSLNIVGSFTDSFDPFQFSLEIGQKLTSASLQFTGNTISDGTVDIYLFRGSLFETGSLAIGDRLGTTDDIDGLDVPVTKPIAAPGFPYELPLFSFLVGASSAGIPGAATAQFRYNVILEVDQVAVIPLPAAFPLFLTGLAGLALIRRRRRQA